MIKRKLKDFKINNIYILTFTLIVIIGYFPIWSNNKSLIWNIDGIGQYYPAFLYIGEYLRNVIKNLFNGSLVVPLYDLSIGLGEDIIGSLNYYGFGDPINLLAVFANKNNGQTWFTISYFIRTLLAGLAFQKYCAYMNLDKISSVAGSLVYIFCGFSIVGGTYYIEWLSVLIYLPLMLLETEKLVKNDKGSFWLSLTVVYGALCGFYFLYMASLCVAVYLLIRLVHLYKKNVKEILIKILKFAVLYVLGLLVSSPIFLPSIKSFFNSERSGIKFIEIIFNINNYIPNLNVDLIYALLKTFTEINYFTGMVYVEALSLIALFLLPKEKINKQLVIVLFMGFVSIHLPIVNYLFNGFGKNNYRWVFVIHFILAFNVVYVSTMIKNINIDFKSKKMKVVKKYLNYFILTAVILNIIINIICVYHGSFGKLESELIGNNEVLQYVESPVNHSKVIMNDNTLYRVDTSLLTNINGRPSNVAFINNYRGTQWWLSMINKQSQSLIDKIYNERQKWRSYGLQGNQLVEAFSGVKYYLTNSSDYDNESIETVVFNNEEWNVYENPYYFGFGYLRNELSNNEDILLKTNINIYYELMYDKYINGSEALEINYNVLSNNFETIINCEEEKTFVLFIPYSSSWHAYVNGEEVEIKNADIAYSSIKLQKGENDIKIIYKLL